MEEIWKPIEGFGGYEVSNLGRVRSTWKGSRVWAYSFTIMQPTPMSNGGHLVHQLKSDEGKWRIVYVHIAVAAAFIGPRPEGLVVAHNDGNPKNNTVENLRYDTKKSNTLDRWKHGTMNTKLTEEEVAVIKKRMAAGHSLKDIHQDYPHITYGSLSMISRGKTWKHVGPDPREGRKQREAAVVRDIKAGDTLSVVAKRYNYHIATVCKIFQRVTGEGVRQYRDRA